MSWQRGLCVAATLASLARAQLTFPQVLIELLQNGSLDSNTVSSTWATSPPAAESEPELLVEQLPAPERIVGPHNFCGGGEEQQYSGLLPAGADTSYFFWLVKSARQPKPGEKIPLLLWLSGGPGCSSALGMLEENGPCRVVGWKNGTWETSRNPWSWSEVGHVVWVDQPAGVGFSQGPIKVKDEAGVADYMAVFMDNFFKHFPDLAQAPFFITGESYAGHYVPAVATKLLEKKYKIEGVALGNALISPEVQFSSQPEMAFTAGAQQGGSMSSGITTDKEYKAMLDAVPACRQSIKACQAKNQTACGLANRDCIIPLMMPVLNKGRNPYDLRKSCPASLMPMCYNLSWTTAFMRDTNVQKSLGLEQSVYWQACSSAVGVPFAHSGDIFQDFAKDIVTLLAADTRVLIYNGDCDFMVDWIGSKNFLKQLHWPHGDEWSRTSDQPFIVDNEARGMQRSANGLTFVQIYNSGHLVPMDQPVASFAMIREFVSPMSAWISGDVPRQSTVLSELVQWNVGTPFMLLVGISALFGGGWVIMWVLKLKDARCKSTQEDYLYLS